MKTKLITSLSLPFCLLTLYSNATIARPPQPQNCPSAAIIQSVGVSHDMVNEDDGTWLTGRRDQLYGTSSNWTFIIGKINATSSNDAFNKAVTGLSTLRFVLGPIIGPLDKWVCYYKTDVGYPAIAINPPVARLNLQPFLK